MKIYEFSELEGNLEGIVNDVLDRNKPVMIRDQKGQCLILTTPQDY